MGFQGAAKAASMLSAILVVASGAEAQVYRISFSGDTYAGGDVAASGFTGTYLVDIDKPYLALPMTVTSGKETRTLTTQTSYVTNSAVGTTGVVQSDTNPLIVSFVYDAYGYDHTQAGASNAFDRNNLPASLPFFSDPNSPQNYYSYTAAGVHVDYGDYSSFLSPGGGRVTSVSAEKISAGSFSAGQAGVSQLVANYTPWIHLATGYAATAYSYLAKSLNAAAAIAANPTNTLAAVRTFLKDEALGAVVEGTKNADLEDAGHYYNAAVTISEALHSNSAARQLALLGLVAGYDADGFKRISNDPADSNFTDVFVPSVDQIGDDLLGGKDDASVRKTLDDLLQYNGDLVGLLHSVERFEGAGLAGDQDSETLQFAAFQVYKDATMTDAGLVADDIAQLKALDLWSGLSYDSAAFASLLGEQCAAGFSDEDAAQLAAAGFTGQTSSLEVCQGPSAAENFDLSTALENAGTATQAYADGQGASPSVPEPPAWGMMIAGFFLIGCGLRRREVANLLV